MTLTFQIVCLLFQVSKETYYRATRDLLEVSTRCAPTGIVCQKSVERDLLWSQKRPVKSVHLACFSWPWGIENRIQEPWEHSQVSKEIYYRAKRVLVHLWHKSHCPNVSKETYHRAKRDLVYLWRKRHYYTHSPIRVLPCLPCRGEKGKPWLRTPTAVSNDKKMSSLLSENLS
jgi:hypothetical protein